MSNFLLKELFDTEFQDRPVDDKLAKRLIKFVTDWENKTEETQEFVNSPLLGVHPIRFSVADENELFDDILRIDRDILQSKIYRVDGINRNFKVSSNVINLTIAYLLHKALTNKLIDFYILNIYKIFFYKNISSMYSHFFKFNFPRDKAVSLIEQLSERYIIKKVGSWEKVAEYHANMMVIDKKSVSLRGNKSNREKLLGFETSEVVLAVNDMNGRIKDTICGLANALYAMNKKETALIRSTSSFQDIGGEGDSKLASLEGSDYKINNYLYTIINNKNDFIKPKLVDLVCLYFKKVDKKKLIELLDYLTTIDIEVNGESDYIARTMMASGRYLHKLGMRGRFEDVTVCIKRLLGYFRGAKVKDMDLIQAKEIISAHCKEGIYLSNKNALASLVIGVMLYLFARSIYREVV